MPGVKKIPMRQCVGCRERKAKYEFIRVVHTPEDEVLLDTTGRKNGRGAYICKNKDCLEKAFKTGAFNRTFKTEISKEVLDKLRSDMEGIDV